MDSQLQSLSKIFTDRIFRIPDYQRGYAWEDKQLRDFWNDIIQLEISKNHYTGVLTLEEIHKDVIQQWHEDSWIVTSKSYEAFHVVDGQQRLTTAIILIQTILEKIDGKGKLNYTSFADIQKRFIFDSKDDGISRSYIFGYDKDNPSYEYLKTKVFGEHSSTGNDAQITVYTRNLEYAKNFFQTKISAFKQEELEIIFKKVTQHLMFNVTTVRLISNALV